MKNAVKEAIKEKVEIGDHLHEMTEHKGFNYWLLIPCALAVTAATGAFLWVRNWLKPTGE